MEQDFQAERNGHSADSAERGFYAVFRVQPGAYKSQARAKKGYPVEKGFDAVLYEPVFRLMRFGDFPHEIGIFLGYPQEDVVPFLRCLQTGSN